MLGNRADWERLPPPRAFRPNSGVTMMADVAEARKNPAATLLAEIARTHVVMLGLADGDDGMRPMVPHVDDGRSLIYFFTRTSGSLTAKVGLGATGQVAVVGKDGDFFAWLEGAIVQNAERATIDRLGDPRSPPGTRRAGRIPT